MTSNAPYPSPENFRPGDILLPRRRDVSVIEWAGLNVPKWVIDISEDLQIQLNTNEKSELRKWFDLQETEEKGGNKFVTFWGCIEKILEEYEIGTSELGVEDMIKKIEWRMTEFYFSGLLSDNLRKLISEILRIIFQRVSSERENDLSQAILGGYYVGHVAFVDRRLVPSDSRAWWIIESSHTHGGINISKWEDWLKNRIELKASVWHARMIGMDESRAQKILNVAHSYRRERKQYALFDGVDRTKVCLSENEKFKVDSNRSSQKPNDTYIYCSEFIQLCVQKACGRDLADAGKVGGLRLFTPKDLSRSLQLEWLNRPENKNYWEDRT